MRDAATSEPVFPRTFRQRTLILGLLSTLFFSQIFLWLPLLIYVSNTGEFSFGFAGAAWRLAVVAGCGIGGLVFLGSVLGRAVSAAIGYLLLSLTLAVYLQSNFLVWDYGNFEGHPIPWARYSVRGWIDILVWLGVFLVCWRQRTFFFSRVLGYSVLVAVLHLAAVLPFLTTKLNSWWFDGRVVAGEDFSTLSKSKNVIIVLLDAFSGPALDEILVSTPEYREKLDGFTFYKNVTSEFPSTFLSIPSILTGEPYRGQESVGDYLRETLGKKSLPVRLKEAGFSVGLRTLKSFCSFLGDVDCFGFTMSLRSPGAAKTLEAMELVDLALFRAAPQEIKKIVFNDDRWQVRRIQERTGRRQRTSDAHVNFFNEYVGQLKVASSADSPPTFRFTHLLLPHYPIRVNRECEIYRGPQRITKQSYHDQARCGLKMVEQLTTKLKTLGVLEKTFIIVLGDHGTNLPYPLYTKKALKEKGLPKITRFLPLYLVKPFGESVGFQVSDAPGRLADTAATVLGALEMEVRGEGKNMTSLPEHAPRDREVYNLPLRWAMWKAGVGERTLTNLRKFKVTGPAWEVRSWERVE